MMSIVMLAHDYTKHYKKVQYPVYVQPKLNGIRCVYAAGAFWSRSGKRILGMPKLLQEVTAKLESTGLKFDGELFKLGMPFQDIAASVNRGVNIKENTDIEYNIFDVITGDSFVNRLAMLQGLNLGGKASRIKLVPSHFCESEYDLNVLLDWFIDDKFEGAMVRKVDGLYEPKRSYNLLKYKLFHDVEAVCIGFTEGKGRLSTTIGALVGRLKSGSIVNVGSGLTDTARKTIYENKHEYLGKKFTIKFQEYSKDKVPIFPTFVAWRDYE